jgi:hypothetical protein
MGLWKDRKIYVWDYKEYNFRLRVQLLGFPKKEFGGLGLSFSFHQILDHLSTAMILKTETLQWDGYVMAWKK